MGLGFFSLKPRLATATATIQDHIDTKGYVAASLSILGVDGAGNPGALPILIELTSGQSATLIARAPRHQT